MYGQQKMKYTYKTIEKTAEAEFKDRGSKFLAYSFPVSDTAGVKAQLQEIKKLHPKATHHCYAYRLGTDDLQFRATDDGEPSGTAGKPILGQIDSKELTNTLVIVVRYFGGTLLGVPGLINAYKTAASLVLQLSPVTEKKLEHNYYLHFDYTEMNDIMMIVKQYQCTVIEQEMQLFCSMKIGIPLQDETICLERLKDLRSTEIKAVK